MEEGGTGERRREVQVNRGGRYRSMEEGDTGE